MLHRSPTIWSALTATTLGVFCLLLLMSGCASTERISELAPVAPVAAQDVAMVAINQESVVPALKVERATERAEVVRSTPAGPTYRPTSRLLTKTAQSTPRVATNVAALPPPAIQPTIEKRALPHTKTEATLPLDIKSLEARLKETKAIGTFTKLKLKTQVHDLLGQFRAYYDGQLRASLTDLRRTYDQLVFRVLALVQDADPQLATAIVSSREPIWGILSNPNKFAAL